MTYAYARSAFAGSLLLPLVLGCSGEQDTGSRTPEMPVFEDADLMRGRGIWMHTCRACHLMGVQGAPAVTDDAQWARRLPKGKEALYQSVINGIRGEDGEYRMPPRGGNDRLTVEEVRLAVDYKVAAIEVLKEQQP